ncbi:sialoadhesin-like isoform X1 [Takifugu rubripes]|uniref:Sialoadhesin-like n=2 Tax=Takifugu rubripes TaxID=31033 RepID=A0A674NYP0_TAKRU|nr:sialoadhesin-like isoform X1 [Takifugu rubripes]
MGVGLWLISLLMSLQQAGVSNGIWNLELPDAVLGFYGSCVMVPCRFSVPEQMNPDLLSCSNGGIWRARAIGGPLVIGPGVALPQGEITGDVRNQSCTTVFSRLPEEESHMFFFRLDCSKILKFTYINATRIRLQRDPPPPQLNPMRLFQEGERVMLECSVPVPCPDLPPSITWLPPGDFISKQSHLHQNEDELLTLTSTLTFIASANHHNRSITCSASYPLQNGSTLGPSASTQVLDVQYAPRFTEALVHRTGSKDQTLALVCLSDANPPVSVYSWYRTRDGGQLTLQGEGALLILTASPFGSDEFLCKAANKIGSQRSRPVPLPAGVTTGSGLPSGVPYVLFGLLLLLHVLMVTVNVYKYRRLSVRLQQLELPKENTYANLRTDTLVSDYDQIQPKAVTSDPDYVLPN